MTILRARTLISMLLLGLLFVNCSNDDDEELLGNWIRKSSFDGPARSSATSFVIGSYAYVATGYTGDEYLKDLWAYNSDGDYWEQKANLTGVARSAASGFELDGKGYIGLGYDGTNKLKDFHQYNPDTNTWTQKADFAGSKRRNASVFVIDDKAYLVAGSNNGAYQVDFWMFDPSTDTWTKKRDIDQDKEDDESYNDDYVIVRSNASAFSMNGLGYLACGESSKTIWEYNPATDIWQEKTALEGSGRTDAIGFSINERGFVLLGRSGSSYYDDVWEFKPLEEQNDNDN